MYTTLVDTNRVYIHKYLIFLIAFVYGVVSPGPTCSVSGLPHVFLSVAKNDLHLFCSNRRVLFGSNINCLSCSRICFVICQVYIDGVVVVISTGFSCVRQFEQQCFAKEALPKRDIVIRLVRATKRLSAKEVLCRS